MKPGAFEDDSRSKEYPRNQTVALRTFTHRLIGHFLNYLELMLAFFAFIDISRHYITSPKQGFFELNYISISKPNQMMLSSSTTSDLRRVTSRSCLADMNQ
jgi:hypothetical protein